METEKAIRARNEGDESSVGKEVQNLKQVVWLVIDYAIYDWLRVCLFVRLFWHIAHDVQVA